MDRRHLATLLAIGLLACSRAPKEYVIGAAGPQTLPYGIQNQHGIDLAVAEINRDGGIDGVPLRVLVRDDHASGADAAKIAAEFVANPNVVAVVGHAGSGAEVAAARVYDGGHLAAVASTPSSPNLTGISPWVFRMISSDSVNGVLLARFASDLVTTLHRTPRVAVLYHNDAYGRGLADAFLHSFQGAVIGTDPVGATTDLEPYVAFYRQTRPDLVFVASDEDIGIKVLREARHQQLATTFLGGDGWQGIVEDSASEGAYIGTPFTAQSGDSAVRRFTAAFRAKYGQYPDAHAALAYDATRLVARALQHAGNHRAGIRAYLADLSQTSPFIGLSGPTWFASNDPVGKAFRVTRVEHGLMFPVESP